MTRSFLGSFAAVAFLVFVVIGTAVSVTAQTNFYTDRSAFEADFPGLDLEDFEEARFPAGPVTLCEEPVNSLSNDDCFIPGDIIPGVDFLSDTGEGIVALDAGLFGNPSKIIGQIPSSLGSGST